MSPYVASKLCAEFLSRCYRDTYDTKVGVARLTNIYGPSDRNMSRLVPATICSILQGKQPLLRNDPQTLINCLYVDDVSRALMLFAGAIHQQDLPDEIVGIYSNRELTLQMLVDLIVQQIGGAELNSVDTANQPFQALTVNKTSALLIDQLGWKPEVELEEGLSKTISWYRTNAIK